VSFGADSARAEAELRAGLSETFEGTCVSTDWANGLVTVNIGGGNVVMPMVGDAPWANDRVRVIYVGNKPLCLGARTRANIGTVTAAPSQGSVIIQGDDGERYTYQYNAALTLTSGMRVLMDHAGRVVVCQVSGERPKSIVTVPVPPSPPREYEQTFYPVASANYQNGVYVDNYAEVSANRSAFYYYGTQIRDSIPNEAVVESATIELNQLWDSAPTVSSRLGTHGDPFPLKAAPTLAGAVPISPGSGSKDILSVAASLQTGAAVAVGFYSGYGWRRYGPSTNSGALTFRWTV
jgi:hypothetical protein